MPKLKTHQASAKRFNRTKKGKYLHRKAGQNHFNAREPGSVTRMKRRDIAFSGSFHQTLGKLMPE